MELFSVLFCWWAAGVTILLAEGRYGRDATFGQLLKVALMGIFGPLCIFKIVLRIITRM